MYVCSDIWAPFPLFLKPKCPGMLPVMRKRWPRGVEMWGESLWLEEKGVPVGAAALGSCTQRQEPGRLTDLGDLGFWCVF